jgi:hypothetical protein
LIERLSLDSGQAIDAAVVRDAGRVDEELEAVATPSVLHSPLEFFAEVVERFHRGGIKR